MTNSAQFISYLVEQLSRMGSVSARRMFGGHGLFRDGLMFALVVDDQLFLKADQRLAELLLNEGSRQFTYLKKGKPAHINYYLAPESCMDEPDALVDWAGRAFKVALEKAG